MKSKNMRCVYASPIFFPKDLPISSRIPELQRAVSDNQVIIVVGETGSGKTTQLPKLCLQLGRGVSGAIVHTQPRRLAAKGVAQRLQVELGRQDVVGVKIRFDDQTSSENYLQVMTDGLLLNQMTRDPLLKDFDTLIIDEAHERSLNIDFLLGLVKGVLQQRPDFRLIITSATIQHHLFSRFFKDAPVFMVSGRTYPVDICYLGPGQWGQHDQDVKVSGVIEALVQIYKLEEAKVLFGARVNGLDTLVFLPGERQIQDVAKGIRRIFGDTFDILPLYARLATSVQSKVFNPGAKPRVVLATNLAETSITVPRIGFVIDSGLVRMSRYSQRRKVQLLPIEAISRASASQRAGRCGRIAPGVCYRLYDQEDFESRPEFPEAEIHRTHLAGVILQMKAMKLEDPDKFPFIEPPALKMINDGYQLLEELDAVRDRCLTPLGRKMAKLPVDPRIARLICSSGDSLYEALIIASALSVMDVLDIPQEARDAARSRYAGFESNQSDFITMVLLWHRLEWHRRHLTRKEFTAFCQKNFVSLSRFYEWRDVHKQLKLLMIKQQMPTEQNAAPKTKWARYLVSILERSDLDEPPYLDWKDHLSDDSNAAIHLPIIAAFATQIACADPETGGFISCRQRLCFVHPSSKVRLKNKSSQLKYSKNKEKKHAKTPVKPIAQEWILVAEFVETQKLWARQVAKINIDWVVPQVRHLLRYTFAEPVWSKKMGAVIAQRTSRLFGLIVKAKESVQYKSIDPIVTRQIFIQAAFVEQQLGDSRFDAKLTEFMMENQALIEKVQALEARERTSGLMATDDEIFTFFDQVIPANILDRRSFFGWWKKARIQNPALLKFTEQWFIKASESSNEYPSIISIGEDSFDLEYHFEPGDPLDGVTILIPEAKLYSVNHCVLEWLVPGLLPQKCEALIRGLPKQDRKRFVPIPQFVKNFMNAGFETTEPLTLCMELFLEKLTGYQSINLSWPKISGHLKMKIKVIGENNKLLHQGDCLDFVRAGRRVDSVSSVVTHPAKLVNSVNNKRDDIVYVSQFRDLPELLKARTTSAGLVFTTLGRACSHTGGLPVIETPDYIQAEHGLYDGIRALLLLQMSSLVKSLKRTFTKRPEVRKMVATFESSESTDSMGLVDIFWNNLIGAAFESVFFWQDLPRSAGQAQTFLESRSELVPYLEKNLEHVVHGAKLHQDLLTKMKFLRAEPVHGFSDLDLIRQFEHLFSFQWFARASSRSVHTWLGFVQCVEHRFEKRMQRAGRDDVDAKKILTFEDRLAQASEIIEGKPLTLRRQLAELFWMLQALRAGLFVQHIKISPKISLKNFEKNLVEFEIALRKN